MFFNASTNHALGSTANIVRNERKLCKRVDKIYFYTQRAQLNLTKGKDIKFAWIFFTAYAVYICDLVQI